MTQKFIPILIIAIQGVYSWGDLQPDVKFDQSNDRFDITDFVKQQNRYFRGTEKALRENRRSTNDNAQKDIINRVYNAVKRRTELNVADDDDKDSADKYRLQKLVDGLHGNTKSGRRNIAQVDPEEEILLHYAVPINMKVAGFLQVPPNALQET